MSWQWGALSILQKTSNKEILVLHSWNVRSFREWPLSLLTEFLSSCSHYIFIKIYNMKMNGFKGIQSFFLISYLQINWFSPRFSLDLTFSIFCKLYLILACFKTSMGSHNLINPIYIKQQHIFPFNLFRNLNLKSRNKKMLQISILACFSQFFSYVT